MRTGSGMRYYGTVIGKREIAHPASWSVSLARNLVLLMLCCFAFAGYGSDRFAVTGAPISGKLLSGTLPVAKAHVYLMAVGETGYGKASVSLLDARSGHALDSEGAYVETAEDGSFTIPGHYRCDAGTSVYIYTRGGDSGLGHNRAATELAAIGPCPQAKADVPPVVVDEVTTVAMSFALAGFADDALHIASSHHQHAGEHPVCLHPLVGRSFACVPVVARRCGLQTSS
jgi:hypothetical protein